MKPPPDWIQSYLIDPYQSNRKNFVWYNILIVSMWHIGFLYTVLSILPKATTSELSTLFILLWYLSGLGITAGAHRLWAHKSYEAVFLLRVFLMLCNAMAFQGSIFEWARDHRVHHKGSETESDPHNAKRGFFFSHCGWVFVRKHPKVIESGKALNVSDLLNDPVVAFQKSYYLILALLMCYGVPTAMGYYLFNSAWNGFWIGGVFRHVWVLHMTWCVNSVAHMWGDRPYDPKINPAENLFVSIGAIGEGWHNYHHKYPSDYATGEWGIFSGQWNPTKTFIDLCAMLGLAYNLKRSRTAKKTRERNNLIAKKQEKEKKKTGDSIALDKDSDGGIYSSTRVQWKHALDNKLGRLVFGRTSEEMF